MCDSGFLEAEDLYGGMGVGKNCGPCNLIFTIKSSKAQMGNQGAPYV